MKNEFNKRFLQLEEKRRALFSELNNYSDDIINKKPAPATWSVTEVVLHLMAADEASLLYLQKKTLGTSSAEQSGLKELGRFFILKIAFLLPLKFKAPKVTTPASKHFTLQELKGKWDSIKDQTLTLVNKLNEEDIKKNLWRHPVAGKMNLIQMIDFFTIHFDRHREQIERTLKTVLSK